MEKTLTASEQRVYNAIMRSFPATPPDIAYDHAIQGGTNFQFISK